MIGRLGYDLFKGAWRLLWQYWPALAVWFAWGAADQGWDRIVAAHPYGVFVPLPLVPFTIPRSTLLAVQPTAALLGPFVLMVVALVLDRSKAGSRNLALAGVFGLLATAVLTGWPEAVRLWPFVGDPRYSLLEVAGAFEPSYWVPMVAGTLASFVGWCVATRAPGLGAMGVSTLQRAASDNHGHADWLDMPGARKLFPGPHPDYGGLAVGEAYRVDKDPVAKRSRFNPRDPRTWGMGGKTPLLIDPCLEAATHALVFAGAGGFKTTSVGVPTLLAWTGAAVVLDPSRELGPMLCEYREQELGHRVVALDPKNAAACGFNVLDWIDPAAPLAEDNVSAVVGWIMGEQRAGASPSSDFFRDKARELITCLLADMLWDPDLPSAEKTLRTLRARLIAPEDQMRELLKRIHQASHSTQARQFASTLMGAVAETFSGTYQNATRETRWLSTAAHADLVSGSAFRTADLTGGKLTVFVQIPLHVLDNTPALGRVVIGALTNAVYEADGALKGRVLFLLDEVARLGYMKVITTARDAGRKYGITFLLLYQSLGQLIEQWGMDGKKSWYESSAWRLFAAIQDLDTARELSAMCGEYGVVSTNSGDTEGNQSRGAIGASTSTGRSQNRSETKRALIKPEEILQDARRDEAFVLVGGSLPLRCGRAIFFRRPEWKGKVGSNRFHQDAAE